VAAVSAQGRQETAAEPDAQPEAELPLAAPSVAGEPQEAEAARTSGQAAEARQPAAEVAAPSVEAAAEAEVRPDAARQAALPQAVRVVQAAQREERQDAKVVQAPSSAFREAASPALEVLCLHQAALAR
jgi:hypothetical protein